MVKKDQEHLKLNCLSEKVEWLWYRIKMRIKIRLPPEEEEEWREQAVVLSPLPYQISNINHTMSSLATLSSQVISPTSFLPYQRLVDISLSCRATSQDILAWEHFFCHRTLLPLSGLSSPSNISFSLVNIATTNKQFTVTWNMSNNSLLIDY